MSMLIVACTNTHTHTHSDMHGVQYLLQIYNSVMWQAETQINYNASLGTING